MSRPRRARRAATAMARRAQARVLGRTVSRSKGPRRRAKMAPARSPPARTCTSAWTRLNRRPWRPASPPKVRIRARRRPLPTITSSSAWSPLPPSRSWKPRWRSPSATGPSDASRLRTPRRRAWQTLDWRRSARRGRRCSIPPPAASSSVSLGSQMKRRGRGRRRTGRQALLGARPEEQRAERQARDGKQGVALLSDRRWRVQP
jgi:hypothetical protein